MGENNMDTGKAIDFLLENGGEIIQYRLQKEILNGRKTHV